ncbi:hypothetical protein FN846DRAFT_496750 [Sphaerosporella brunnea]|uniref:Uncharacterized protein n=1 Tax=Sphaerosporella brunnea TaxID=1250544 RepID=A0A5J5F436_9PEZI|nr:hypothetical protein FN846DRAFT_496750 [Sphaerosporella brunnea]
MLARPIVRPAPACQLLSRLPFALDLREGTDALRSRDISPTVLYSRYSRYCLHTCTYSTCVRTCVSMSLAGCVISEVSAAYCRYYAYHRSCCLRRHTLIYTHNRQNSISRPSGRTYARTNRMLVWLCARPCLRHSASPTTTHHEGTHAVHMKEQVCIVMFTLHPLGSHSSPQCHHAPRSPLSALNSPTRLLRRSEGKSLSSIYTPIVQQMLWSLMHPLHPPPPPKRCECAGGGLRAL